MEKKEEKNDVCFYPDTDIAGLLWFRSKQEQKWFFDNF